MSVLRDVPMGVDRRKTRLVTTLALAIILGSQRSVLTLFCPSTRYWLFEDAHSEVRVFTERVGEGYTTASWELVSGHWWCFRTRGKNVACACW